MVLDALNAARRQRDRGIPWVGSLSIQEVFQASVPRWRDLGQSAHKQLIYMYYLHPGRYFRCGHSSTATARAGATLWSTGSRKGPLLAIRRYGIEQTSNAVRTTIKPVPVETTHADSTKFECRGVRPRFRFSEEDDFAFSDCFRAAGSLATPQFLSSLSLFVVRDVPLIVRVILAHAASCNLGGWLSRADFHYFPRLRSRIVFQVAAR
jgi:hypothetical protein